jgi:hypothetical protein
LGDAHNESNFGGRYGVDLPEIFVMGSAWFWLLLLGETILLVLLLEYDQGAIATLAFVATLLLLQFLGDVDIFGYGIRHPWTVALGAAAYLVVGTGWAIAKWWFYVRERRAWYEELRAAFVQVHGLERQSPLPEDLQPCWQRCLVAARRHGQRMEAPPLAAQHKPRILWWMSYWPWSLAWTMLKDPVRKAFLSIYHQIADYLQEIADKAFRDVQADLPKEDGARVVQRFDPILAEFGVAEVVAAQKAEMSANRLQPV